MALSLREAARALILDPDDHVLLVRFEFPTLSLWTLPGGGLDEGETPEQGLRRELHEELGLDDVEIGPHIWNRVHVFPMSTGHNGQRDRVHLIRSRRFEPQPTIGWEQLRAELVHEIRWWTVEEIGAAATTEFAPRRLHGLLDELLTNGVPATPIDTGI